MNQLLWKVRNTAVADRAYRAVRNAMQGTGWGGFHQDKIYQGLMLDLLDAFPFTSFVETGTYRGYSTELVASHFPSLPVYTSEVVEWTYTRSKSFLRKYSNISCLLGSSDGAVDRLIQEKKLGDLPLFYLDAHWERHWPLRMELEHIGRSGMRCVIVIDDFEVPGVDWFDFCIDGGGEVTAGEKCNAAYITPTLRASGQSYQTLYPKYTRQDAFGPSGRGSLCGHIVLFQNTPKEYEAFLRRPFAQTHYTGMGALQTS